MPAETPLGPIARAEKRLLDLRAAGPDDTQRAIDAIKQFNDRNLGVVPSNTLDMSTAPTATDTVTIGADVYEFVAASGTVAADTNIAVTRTGTAATDLAALIAAINATTKNNAHANILKSDGTAALANGTEPVKADSIATNILRIRFADRAGGLPKAPDTAAEASIACSDALTPSVAWLLANMNEAPYRVASPFLGHCLLKITAGRITDGTVRVSFPFKVTGFGLSLVKTTSSGLPVEAADYTGTGADTFVINNNEILVTLGGGAAPDLQAGDEVLITALGEEEFA